MIPLAVLSSASIRLTTARECGRTFIGVSLSSDKSFGCPVRSPARASGYSTLSYNRRIPSNSSHRLSVELPEEVHVVVPRLRSGWRPRRGQIVRTRWAAASSAYRRGITPPRSRSGIALLRCCNQKWPFVRISGAPESWRQIWRPFVRTFTSR